MAAKELVDEALQKSQNADVNAPRSVTLYFDEEFIKRVEEFMGKHPELGLESAREAVCHAWNTFRLINLKRGED